MVIRGERRSSVQKLGCQRLANIEWSLRRLGKSTIVMLPPAADVLLFEVSISWMWAF